MAHPGDGLAGSGGGRLVEACRPTPPEGFRLGSRVLARRLAVGAAGFLASLIPVSYVNAGVEKLGLRGEGEKHPFFQILEADSSGSDSLLGRPVGRGPGPVGRRVDVSRAAARVVPVALFAVEGDPILGNDFFAGARLARLLCTFSVSAGSRLRLLQTAELPGGRRDPSLFNATNLAFAVLTNPRDGPATHCCGDASFWV